MSALGRIEIASDDGLTAVVALVGAIDLAVSQDLRGAFAGISSPNVVVEMSETMFIDSVTIGTLVAARQEGRLMVLRGVTGQPLRVLEQSGVIDFFYLQQ